jgi:invasion protein IalB
MTVSSTRWQRSCDDEGGRASISNISCAQYAGSVERAVVNARAEPSDSRSSVAAIREGEMILRARGWAVLLVLGGLCVAAVFAQSQTTAKSPETPKPVDAAGSVTPPTAPAAPKIQRSETLAAGNWTVTCTETVPPDVKRRCSAMLKMAQNQNNVQRVAFTWLMGMKDGKRVSVVSMPSGIRIGPGVALKVGANEARKFAYSLCQPDHCEAVIPLEDALAKELATSPAAEVSVVAINGGKVKFTPNLTGFDQALAEVTK